MDKAQSLSVNTLIVVALGILILVIGVAMYNKYSDGASDTISSCENRNGECLTVCPEGTLKDFTASCPQEGQNCCIGG